MVGWLLLGAYVVGWISVVIFSLVFCTNPLARWCCWLLIIGSNSSSELKAKTQMYMVGYLSCRFNFWISLCLLLIAVCIYEQSIERSTCRTIFPQKPYTFLFILLFSVVPSTSSNLVQFSFSISIFFISIRKVRSRYFNFISFFFIFLHFPHSFKCILHMWSRLRDKTIIKIKIKPRNEWDGLIGKAYVIAFGVPFHSQFTIANWVWGETAEFDVYLYWRIRPTYALTDSWSW